jgi:hypothetical protein
MTHMAELVSVLQDIEAALAKSAAAAEARKEEDDKDETPDEPDRDAALIAALTDGLRALRVQAQIVLPPAAEVRPPDVHVHVPQSAPMPAPVIQPAPVHIAQPTWTTMTVEVVRASPNGRFTALKITRA